MDIAVASNPGARPRMLTCYLCGREFGTKSLPIHIPQCQEKWLNEENKKPKKERRPLPQPPKDVPCINGPTSPKDIDAFNEAMYEHWEKEVLESCPYCGRRFKPEALKIHNRSCTAEKPAKPAGTALTSASLSNNLSPGAISGTKHVARGAPGSSPEESVSPKAGTVKHAAGRVESASPKRAAEGLRASASCGLKTGGDLRASSEGKLLPGILRTTGVGAANGNLRGLDHGASLDKTTLGGSLNGTKAASVKGPIGDSTGTSERKGVLAKFCDDCGAAFPKETSKFCSECGSKRPGML